MYSKLINYVHVKYLYSFGISKIIFSVLRKLIVLLFHDPRCRLPIHNHMLYLPSSHALPTYLRECTYYDKLPKRIGQKILELNGQIIGIDVGANIGDSIAAFQISNNDLFLAIEPNPHFAKYLHLNWGTFDNIIISESLCSSDCGEVNGEFNEKNGTASIQTLKGDEKIVCATLDQIIEENPIFSKANLLKVDTDGHDFKVLNGAKKLIRQNQPTVLFECDIFNNDNYMSEVIEVLKLFKEANYAHAILYDNYGYLIGKYSIQNTNRIRDLLLYQSISTFQYFDILLMNEEYVDEFYKSELEYFINGIANRKLKANFLENFS